MYGGYCVRHQVKRLLVESLTGLLKFFRMLARGSSVILQDGHVGNSKFDSFWRHQAISFLFDRSPHALRAIVQDRESSEAMFDYCFSDGVRPFVASALTWV